jgi:hypothetical protein
MKQYRITVGGDAFVMDDAGERVLVKGEAGLAIEILRDALKDETRAIRLYKRFEHRMIRTRSTQRDTVFTFETVMKTVEAIETVEAEAAMTKRIIANEPAPRMSPLGDGAVWDQAWDKIK